MLTARYRILLTAVLACQIGACASLTQPSQGRSPLDVSLTEPCPPLNQVPDGSVATVLRWIIGTAEAYSDCAAKHRRLVEATR